MKKSTGTSKLAQIRRGIRLAKIYIKAHQLETLEVNPARARNINQDLTNSAHSIMHGPDGDPDSYIRPEFWKESEPPYLFPETKAFRKAFRTTMRKYFDKIDIQTTT